MPRRRCWPPPPDPSGPTPSSSCGARGPSCSRAATIGPRACSPVSPGSPTTRTARRWRCWPPRRWRWGTARQRPPASCRPAPGAAASAPRCSPPAPRSPSKRPGGWTARHATTRWPGTGGSPPLIPGCGFASRASPATPPPPSRSSPASPGRRSGSHPSRAPAPCWRRGIRRRRSTPSR